jgi:hypothetical protein
MNAIERHYRLEQVAEDLHHLETKVNRTLDGLPEGPQKDDILAAMWQIRRATAHLKSWPSPRDQKQRLVRSLENSIRLVEDSKRLCAEVGSGVLPTNENAQATNLSASENQ